MAGPPFLSSGGLAPPKNQRVSRLALWFPISTLYCRVPCLAIIIFYILKGVQQIDRTWFLKESGRRYFENTAYFNFDESRARARESKELFPDKVKLRIRFFLDNLRLDGDVLNIPLFMADQTEGLMRLALNQKKSRLA